ncbi:MAG: histidine kinase [Bacteroidota bacterium]
MPNLRFDNYTGRYGLYKEYSSDVIRDSLGYIWLCNRGLYRFDGARVIQYNTFNKKYGLKVDYVNHLQLDQTGRLWVGNAGGLLLYNRSEDKFDYINSPALKPFKFAYSCRIIGNHLWFVTQYGLCKLNLDNSKIDTTALDNVYQPWMIYGAKDSTIICTTVNDKYFVYNAQTNKYKSFSLKKNGESIRIKTILFHKGMYWMGTNKGLWTTPNPYQLPTLVEGTASYNIKIITKYTAYKGDDLFWLATNGNGLCVFNAATEKMVTCFMNKSEDPFSLAADNINSIHIDKDNRMWLATESGLSVLNPAYQHYKIQIVKFQGSDKSDNNINAVTLDKYNPNIAWIIARHQGLLKINWQTKQIIRQYKIIGDETVENGSKGSSFFDMIQLDTDQFILAKTTELVLWNKTTNTARTIRDFQLPLSKEPFEIRKLVKPPGNTVYIASSDGLLSYTLGEKKGQVIFRKKEENLLISPNNFFSILYDSVRNFLWAGGVGGIINYHLSNRRMEFFTTRSLTDTTAVDAVINMALDNKGRIISASSVGINVFDYSSKTSTAIRQFGNFTDVPVLSVFSKGDYLWLSTLAGVLQYNIKTTATIKLSMPSPFAEEFTTVPFTKLNNELAFGNRNAYTLINMTPVVEQKLPSAALIQQVTINQRPFLNEQATPPELTHKQNNISFSFTAFEFDYPDNISFRYKLDKVDSAWITDNESRVANYSNLAPGSYTFLLQSGNNNGEWNKKITQYSFIIHPPFWQTWWFRLLLITSFVSTVIFIARQRIKRIRLLEEIKTDANKQMVDLEMKVFRSQMNPHFIFNSLNSIQKYIWENKQEDAAEYLGKFSRLIRLILEHSMYKLVTLEQEVIALQLYLELEHRRCNNKFDYTIQVHEDIQTSQVLITPMLIQPYVENAIWHGLLQKDGRGLLSINIQQQNEKIICIIEDNGIGRAKAEEIKNRKEKKVVSYGMQITEQRLRMLESKGHFGKIAIEDLYDTEGNAAGTKITLDIPVEIFKKIG